MVRALLYMMCFCWIGLGLEKLHAAPFIDASIDSMNSQAHFPLQGTITITHSKEEKIDPNSFILNDKSLETSFVKDVKMSASSDTFVSIYSFQLPAQEKGLYVLPSISLKINGQTYTTTPSTYQVREETAEPAVPKTPTPPTHSKTPAASAESSPPLIFHLEASVQGPSVLYPGERTKLLYRISYNRSIDLTRSMLPMVHPAHFQKVGDVQIRDYQIEDVTVQDLTQEVEASEVGTFSFGPSLIEGYAYSMKYGQKIYDSTLLKSETPVIAVEVKPFPENTQPASFTGALGSIQVEASLISPSTVKVGDTLQLQVKVQGIDNLTQLHLPLLQCEPGFSGFFQTSDLPPLADVKENHKVFDVELRPLTALINQIPSIEISSFDPAIAKYVVQKTDPISLKIQPIPFAPPPASIPLLAHFSPVGQWPDPVLSPLEIEGNVNQQMKLTHSRLKRQWVLWLIPIGAALILLQQYWRKQLDQRPKPQIPQSEKLFKQALKRENLHLLEQAFWQRLWERNIVQQGTFDLDKLKSAEELASLRAFMFQLQSLQYSSHKTFDLRQIQETAKQQFDQI